MSRALPGGRSGIPKVRTERLILRGFRDSDRDAFAVMNGDPAVMEHFPMTLDRAASDALLDRIRERWAADGHGQWAVERRSDGAFLGFTGLARLAWLHQPEVGWRYVPSAWGHGYATEAAEAALRFGFLTLAVPEIVSVTTIGNERSQRLMQRLGMHRDPADDFLHPNIAADHPLRPHVMYRLTRDEWLARAADAAGDRRQASAAADG